MTPATALLSSILAMGGLHFVMMVWLYVSRLTAMKRAGITFDNATWAAMRKLPNWALNPAANYNNLTEAPPLFYAVTLAIVLLGQADGVFVGLAWTYVLLRIAHSLWQALINIIAVRVVLFGASWLVLGVMIARSAWLLI
ncbi:MAPEG family protein [Asticcacaulis sp. 201]|uniref:MAPEG family protein n=1 Tax=Asticcacaulis sp. 201 TaxID=3028787 RepID=UPI0029160AD6|nr:MAPEG family protein [Asticcacaulis sp. 201]MDV6331887.1 MAPEG family protein [Asticcacaulis sp. 201]